MGPTTVPLRIARTVEVETSIANTLDVKNKDDRRENKEDTCVTPLSYYLI